ncbi:MAG: hypothetical protein PHY16_17720 [Methylobacter sp.]|nr:hypothetical protein [Methylobacter sp.]
MIKLTGKFLALCALLSLVLVPACAEVKDAGKTIGHTTRNVTREIGHGTRDVTRAIGHGSRDTVKAIGKGTKEVVKSVTDDSK